jgi:hypothetical protein
MSADVTKKQEPDKLVQQAPTVVGFSLTNKKTDESPGGVSSLRQFLNTISERGVQI